MSFESSLKFTMKTSSLFAFLTLLFVTMSEGSRCQSENTLVEALASGANDIVVVRQPNGDLMATHINLQIGKFTNWLTILKSRKGRQVKILVNGIETKLDSNLLVRQSGVVCFERSDKSDFLTNEELLRMNLNVGWNEGLFVVDALNVEIPFSIFFLDQSSRLVITDIDGTITKSNIEGYVFPHLGVDIHQDQVIELFQKIAENNYTMVYLTARSMANDEDTRKYLFKDLQNIKGFSIPRGPLFMAPIPFTSAVYEAVTSPSNTKAITLSDLTKLFSNREKVIYGAYGNSNTDVEAYLTIGIDPSLIYLVNKSGTLRQVGNNSVVMTYGDQALRVNELYP